jgi:hypothetical protein
VQRDQRRVVPPRPAHAFVGERASDPETAVFRSYHQPPDHRPFSVEPLLLFDPWAHVRDAAGNDVIHGRDDQFADPGKRRRAGGAARSRRPVAERVVELSERRDGGRIDPVGVGRLERAKLKGALQISPRFAKFAMCSPARNASAWIVIVGCPRPLVTRLEPSTMNKFRTS